MVRVESGNVIKIKIGSHEFPIAVKVGRKLYRVCPVCGAVFSSATGWKKHIDTYHPEFFDYVSMLRIKELVEIKSGLAQTGKSCIDRLISLIPDGAAIYYYEDNGNGYNPVGYVDKRTLIEYLKQFTCRDIRLRMVRLSPRGIAYAGKSKVKRYFRIMVDKSKSIRFTVNGMLIDAMIGNGIIKKANTNEENPNRPKPILPQKPHQNQ